MKITQKEKDSRIRYSLFFLITIVFLFLYFWAGYYYGSDGDMTMAIILWSIVFMGSLIYIAYLNTQGGKKWK